MVNLPRNQVVNFSEIPTLDGVPRANADESGCATEIKKLVSDLKVTATEKAVSDITKKINQFIKDGVSGVCELFLKDALMTTIYKRDLKLNLKFNQTLTVTIKKKFLAADGTPDTKTWSKTFKTERRTPWLIHYGLTYGLNALSHPKTYFSKADPEKAGQYIITEENDNGPKAWENISGTMNFTYPFGIKERDVKLGFTGGFGLNPALQLSGHTGLSIIFADNIILSSGFVVMQKYQLKGEYNGDGKSVLKENLGFDSLHKKVWLPEVYVTIGFRFNKNPFEKKDDESKPDAK